MATLISLREKVTSFHLSDLFFRQTLNILEDSKSSTRDLGNTINSGTVIPEGKAESIAQVLQKLLDTEQIQQATFATRWWLNGRATILALHGTTKNSIAQQVNSTSNRHYYFGHQDHSARVSDEDITLSPLEQDIRDTLADMTAFIKLSRGFEVHWQNNEN